MRGRASCWRRSIMPTRSARWRPSARFSPCSTARAARRSAVMRRSRADGLRFRGMIVKPDGSEAFEAAREGDVRDAEKLGADAGARTEGPRRPRFLQRMTMRLLVTRPEPDNERTAAALRAQGHEVVLAPLLRIEAVRRCRSRRAAVGRDPDHQRQRRARARRPSPARRTAGAAGAGGRPQQRRGGACRGLRRCDVGRRRRRRSGAARGRALCRRAAAAALSRRRGPRPAIWPVPGARRSAPSWSIAPPRRTDFRPRRVRRWSRAGSTACCISPGAASKAISIAAATSSGRRSSPRIIACRRGPPSRCGSRAPRALRWPRSRTRRACSLWSRQSHAKALIELSRMTAWRMKNVLPGLSGRAPATAADGDRPGGDRSSAGNRGAGAAGGAAASPPSDPPPTRRPAAAEPPKEPPSDAEPRAASRSRRRRRRRATPAAARNRRGRAGQLSRPSGRQPARRALLVVAAAVARRRVLAAATSRRPI